MEPALLAQLRDDLGRRRIRQGISAMERLRPALEALEPCAGAGVLVGIAAQWMDAGFDDASLIECLLARFTHSVRAALPVIDYLHLRMAEAAVALAHENFEDAESHLQLVLRFEQEVEDPEMFAIANFWAGRSLRRRGRYDDALEYTQKGERLALVCGYTEMAAIMQATLSWLAFQRGRLNEAGSILKRAEEALNLTDDFLSRGNIQSAYGRIARRQGKYDLAVERFDRAISEFRLAGDDSQQLARTLGNLAFVKRLLAVRMQQNLDARPGKSGDRDARRTIEETREAARRCLAEAAEIYSRHENHHGIAGLRITEGFLHLDAGDLEQAAAEAAEAFGHGTGKSDYIVMARARVLQSMVENAAIEEQLGDAAQHREAAEAFARDAVAFAGQTENRRLLARALVWQGIIFTVEPADPDSARHCCEQAMSLLQPEGFHRQYVWEDLEMLKARVLHAQPVDAILRAWSAGIVEGQTFQQMTEEFARIVIPRVWEREGRKVSRVAGKLSISPKKVRRILATAGRRAAFKQHV